MGLLSGMCQLIGWRGDRKRSFLILRPFHQLVLDDVFQLLTGVETVPDNPWKLDVADVELVVWSVIPALDVVLRGVGGVPVVHNLVAVFVGVVDLDAVYLGGYFGLGS